MGWTSKPIEDLCLIGDGNHSSKYPKTSEMVAAGVPFIRSGNLIDGNISPEEMLYITKEKHKILRKGHLKARDVLFTNRGEIGKVAMVSGDFDGANLNSQIAWLRCRNDLIPEYLFFFLQSREMRDHFARSQSGAALQQFTIKMIKEVSISYPPVNVQNQLVYKLARLAAETRKLEDIYNRKLARLGELKQTILEKAFSGELRARSEYAMQEALA